MGVLMRGLILLSISLLIANRANSQVFIGTTVEFDNNVSSTIYYADVPTNFSNIMDLKYMSINLTDNPDTLEMTADFVDFDPQSQQIYFMGRFGSGVIIDLNGTLVRIFAEDQHKVAGMRVHVQNSRVYWIEKKGLLRSTNGTESDDQEIDIIDLFEGPGCGCGDKGRKGKKPKPELLALEIDEENSYLFISIRLDIFHVIRTNLSVEENFTLSDLDWMPIEDMHYDGVHLYYSSGFGD
eukprot:XP_011674794.1 PREDICTED: uncharacterized protein LOC105443401 [Strongylocentrotus purpuratus]